MSPENSLVMLSSDAALPCDRPNLSKDYLAGAIPFEYVPLRNESFYEENGIEIQLGKTVAEFDLRAHEACRLFVIRKEDLEDLLFVDRDLAYDLLWSFVRTLSGRLRETNDKMTFMAVTSKF